MTTHQTTKRCALVHGAWHGSWSWQKVTPYLERAGLEVTTFTLPGVGERSNEDISSISFQSCVDDLLAQLKDTFKLELFNLIGHSFGGAVSLAAAGHISEQVNHLMLLDSVFLDNGECVFSYADSSSDGFQADPENPLTIPVPDAALFGIENQDLKDWVQKQLTPHPINTFRTPATLVTPLSKMKNVTYVHYTSPEELFIQPLRDKADVLGWQVHNVPCCHDALVTHPEETAKLIMDSIET